MGEKGKGDSGGERGRRREGGRKGGEEGGEGRGGRMKLWFFFFQAEDGIRDISV